MRASLWARQYFALGAVVLAALPASAAVTYTYVGNNYTSVYGTAYTYNDHVTLTFTVPEALPANGTEAVTPTSYSAFDGLDTISSPQSEDTAFDIQTTNGKITAWDIAVQETYSNEGYNVGSSASIITSTGLADSAYVDQGYQFACPNENCEEQFAGDSYGAAGVWTSVANAAPEPGVWALMMIGTTAVGLALRTARRRLALAPAA